MNPRIRTPWIVGNWKLFHGLTESARVSSELATRYANARRCDIGIAPTFLAVTTVRNSGISVGAQDAYWEPEGAFTGEVSAALVKDAGCTFCIVGHSERRQLFGETDDAVRRKAKAALDAQLTPIVCVGETLQEREDNATLAVVLGQIERAVEGLSEAEVGRLAIAYEPVWAIGTGKTARPEDAQTVQRAIRACLGQRTTPSIAEKIRILYGGSVKPDNAKALFHEPDIDEALVGGASLKVESFAAIVAASSE